jgi:hypothetical protein
MRTRYLLICAFVLSITGALANPGSAAIDLESIVGMPYDGQIDDFGFFNVVLTQDEINEVMTVGLTVLSAVEPSDKLTITWASIKNQ